MNKNFLPVVCILVALLIGGLILGQLSEPAHAPETGDANAASGSRKSGDLSGYEEIQSINIRDREVLRGTKPIIITFTAPMVAKEDLHKPVAAKDMPFTLVPEVPGEGQWATVTTFAFIPSKNLPRGTRFRLDLRKGLRSLAGKDVQYFFSFNTEAVNLNRITLGGYNAETFEQQLFFDFQLPVRKEALAEHLSVTDPDTGDTVPFDLITKDNESSSHVANVKLGEKRLKLNVNLRKDEDGDQHPLALSKPYMTVIGIKTPGETQARPRIEGSRNQVANFTLRPYTSENGQGKPYAYFYLNQNIASHDQKQFIKVTPELPYYIENDSRIIVSEGVEPGMVITLTLLPGLVNSEGNALAKEVSSSITIPDYEGSVRFSESGNVLTPIFGSRIAVDMVNLDRINLRLHRVYDNNLPFMSLDSSYETYNLMRSLVVKEIEINDAEKNVPERRAIDLSALANGKRGVFRLSLTGYQQKSERDGSTYYSYRGEDERLVILTDIGITTRVYPDGISVYATSLSSAKPLGNAQVKVYSRSNQLIASGSTRRDGVFIHKRSERWDPQLQPNVVTVQYGRGEEADLTFLALEYYSEKELQDDSYRSYLKGGYEAFVYPPRGVFRPGEQVDIKAFVRNSEQQAPAPFPVLFRIMSSRGLEIARGSATLSEEGGADFSFKLPVSAPTGEYSAYLEIPGQQDERIGNCYFSVEDFVPPRLEVEIAPDADVIIGNQEFSVDISGQYLFGAPGADLNYEVGYKATPVGFYPEGWENYRFGNQEKSFSGMTSLKYLTGELEKDGKQSVHFPIPEEWTPPARSRVLLIAAVQEDNGRWVNQTSSVMYYPTSYLLGLAIENDYLALGKENQIRVAAVDPEGKAVDCGPVEVDISEVQVHWQTVYRNGRYVSVREERIIPVLQKEFETSDGLASIPFTPDRHSRYLVRVSAEDGTIMAARRVHAWRPSYDGEPYALEEGTGRMDAVELSLDKNKYRVGETAKLSIKAPYAGTLFLGLERDEQLWVRTIPLDTAAAVVDIPVTEKFMPNVKVTAWVIRPVQETNKEWYAHRAFGMATIALAREPYTLAVTAETPERATPSSPLSIPFTVVDEQGNPVAGEFSVALIDEGILSLTGYRTPNPIAFFMEARRALGRSYDAFDALLRPEAKATPLLAVGGDGPSAEDYQGSLTTEQIFLTAYLPTVRTNADGKGLANFDIPEYSGKGRLMLIGASGDRFASMASQVRFARDVVVEASAPRAVAPGDTFEVAIKLFTMASADNPLQGEARVNVTAEGPLQLAGETSASIPLANADGTKVTSTVPVTATALQASGIAKVTVAVTVPGRDDLSFEKTFEVAVRPPYPRTSASVTSVVGSDGTQTVTVPGDWLPGTAKTAFSIDETPVLSVLPALEFLREYPYGCLEQTTSRAWPYLTLKSVQKAINPESKDDTSDAVLADAVSRIIGMQNHDGGFGAWPGYSTSTSWKSVNAIMLLVEAKSRVQIPKNVLERSYNYLRFILSVPVENLGNKSFAYSTKAFAAFVLSRAGEPPLGWIQHLSEHENIMYPSGRLFLAGAKALHAGNPDALRALRTKKLDLSGAVQDNLNLSLESNLRNLCLELYMWALVAPQDPFTYELCVKVADALRTYRWFNTQDAGMAALALGTWLEKNEGHTSSGDYTLTVSVDGKEIAKAAKGQRLLFGTDVLPVNAQGKAADVKVTMQGSGSAYCVYSVRGVPLTPPAADARDMSVQRVWKDGDGNVLDFSDGEVRIKKGDRITVELTVQTRAPLADVVVSDLLPGGMEVENPRLNTASQATGEQGDRWNMHMDLREDRLLLFFDRINSLTTYTYSMRAVSKGRFVLPPLAAEGMYAPQVNAITSTGVLVVE